MDDISELQQRKNELLGNNDLFKLIQKMIDTKNLPAELPLHAFSEVIDRDNREEIVVRLHIKVRDTNRIVKAYTYITEDIFDLDSFEYIDNEIGLSGIKPSIDVLIKLRFIRVLYNVIKTISSTEKPYSMTDVRLRKDGSCIYKRG